jgi:hypothetical protein
MSNEIEHIEGYVTMAEAIERTGAPKERISELFNKGLFTMMFSRGRWYVQEVYLERIEYYRERQFDSECTL